MPPVINAFSWLNAMWSLSLFAILVGVIWYKLHRLRMEIHALVQSLPSLGSQFIKHDLVDLRSLLDETRARITVCEERMGLDGGEGR